MAKFFEFPSDATTLGDSSGLIPNWVHHLSDLNRVEAENILYAQAKYLQGHISDPKIWFHAKEIKTIHKAMFGNVWQWAGAYRKSITSIGIHPTLIPSQLAEFCFEVLSWLQNAVELTFLEMAARIHHRLVFIHPFENGNGRLSRLISDRFLLSLRCKYPQWPNHMNQEGIIRKDYIQTLKNADKGDYTLLVEFMRKLGASDPPLDLLFTNSFYKTYLRDNKGVALIKAWLRNNNINEQPPTSLGLLQLAIKKGLDDIVKILIDSGANIHLKDRSGLTPLQAAIMKKNKTLVDLLLSKGAAR